MNPVYGSNKKARDRASWVNRGKMEFFLRKKKKASKLCGCNGEHMSLDMSLDMYRWTRWVMPCKYGTWEVEPKGSRVQGLSQLHSEFENSPSCGTILKI